MSRSDRLLAIIGILRDGRLHRAQAIAERLGISLRTVYRDMERLVSSGVPIAGTRGAGYRITDAITLPPLTLTAAELEALNLGLAIAAEAADADLKAAATSLAGKIDSALPTAAIAEADAWKVALSPFADTGRGLGHMPTIRAAIRARQKLRLTGTAPSGTVTTRTVRPLLMQNWGRIWTLTAWCETDNDFRDFRLDLIESAEALAELFADEPGRTLADWRARPPSSLF